MTKITLEPKPTVFINALSDMIQTLANDETQTSASLQALAILLKSSASISEIGALLHMAGLTPGQVEQWAAGRSLPTSTIARLYMHGLAKLCKEVIESQDLPTETQFSPVTDEFLDQPISRLELSTRCANGLARHGITTVRQLVSNSERELLQIEFFGRKCRNEVVEVLAQRGYHLET